MSEYPIEKIVAAVEKVVEKRSCGFYARQSGKGFAAQVKSELTRPAIDPSVPVTYISEHDGEACLLFAGQIQNPNKDTTILIPAPLVMAKAKDRDKYLKEFNGHRIHSDEQYWTGVIADYTAHGASDE